LVITLISLLQFFSDPHKIFWFYDDAGREVFGPFKNRDRFAMFADFVIPIAIVRALNQKNLRQALWFSGIAATLFAAAMATGDRASAILILTEVIVLPVVAYYRGAFPIERLRGAVASFALFAVLFTVVVGYSFILHRFNDKDPYAARRGLLMGSIEMIKARPFFGFGMGNFENAYPGYEVFDFSLLVAHPHNDWAEWTAEGGIPFLVIMLSVAIWAVPKALRTLWGIGLLATFAHSWVDFPLQNPALEFWVFTLIGVMAAENRTAKGQETVVTGG
jgi:O-antigen ligase